MRCALFVVRCVSIVFFLRLFVVVCLVVCRCLFVFVRCLLCVGSCLLLVGCSLLVVVCCLMCVVRIFLCCVVLIDDTLFVVGVVRRVVFVV